MPANIYDTSLLDWTPVLKKIEEVADQFEESGMLLMGGLEQLEKSFERMLSDMAKALSHGTDG